MQIIESTEANNVDFNIRNEIDEQFANEINTKGIYQVIWENEVEVLDAITWFFLSYDIVSLLMLTPLNSSKKTIEAGPVLIVAPLILLDVWKEEAEKTYPDGWKSPLPYIRIVPQPK